MDPPDLGIFLHVQVSCARLQRHGPTRGGAGAHLAGSHHRHAWGELEEQGLTSLDPGEVKPLLTWPALGHPLLEPCPLMVVGSATSGISSMTLCGNVDRISSAVLRGVSHEGRLIGRGAYNQEQEGNRDTRVRQVRAISAT